MDLSKGNYTRDKVVEEQWIAIVQRIKLELHVNLSAGSRILIDTMDRCVIAERVETSRCHAG